MEVQVTFSMKMLNYNIRGLGSQVKRRELQMLIRSHKIEICCVQETKMEDISEEVCREIWGPVRLGWGKKDAVGRSGGMLITWNSEVFNCSSIWCMEGAVIMNRFYGLERIECCIINVYVPSVLEERRLLWDRLSIVIQQNINMCVCVLGDFNSIRHPEERVGSSEIVHRSDMRSFDNFINDALLVDLPLQGRKYTWYKPNGNCKSRIDRVMVNDSLLENWPNSMIRGLPRSISDHCPIILATKHVDWGPKPFRFANMWLSHPEFKVIVSRN